MAAAAPCTMVAIRETLILTSGVVAVVCAASIHALPVIEAAVALTIRRLTTRLVADVTWLTAAAAHLLVTHLFIITRIITLMTSCRRWHVIREDITRAVAAPQRRLLTARRRTTLAIKNITQLSIKTV